MSDRPWYKRYGADFVHGTLGLTLEQKGAYSLCLDLIYDRGGPIPDDARWLAGVCGVSVRKWNTLRDALIQAGKIVASGGHLTNLRAEKEIENALKTSRKHAENGAKGGAKSSQNRDTPNENNDLGQAGLKHRAHKPEARSQTDANASETRAWPPASFDDEFWPVYPHKVGKDAARKAFLKRAKNPPCTLAELLDAVGRYIAEKPPDRQYCNPSTWINEGRWQDEPENVNATDKNGNPKPFDVALDAVRRAHRRNQAGAHPEPDGAVNGALSEPEPHGGTVGYHPERLRDNVVRLLTPED